MISLSLPPLQCVRRMQHPTSSSTAETHECKKCGEKDAAKFGKYKNRDGSIKGLRPTCYKCGQSTIKKRASSNQPADLTQKSSNCTPTSNGDTTASTEPNSYAPTSTTEDKVESLLVKDTDAKTPEIAQCQVEATNSSVSSSARKRTVEVAFEEGNNESVNADQLEPKETPYAETRKEYVAAVSKLSAAAFNIRKDVRNLAKKSRSNNTNQSYTSYKRAYQEYCDMVKDEELLLPNEIEVGGYLLPSDDRIAHFVQHYMHTLWPQRRKRKSKNAESETASFSVCKQAVSAVVDLWKDLKATLNYPPDKVVPHPRGDLVKSVLDSIESTESERIRKHKKDRGLSTILDSYSDQQLDEMIEILYQSPDPTDFTRTLIFLIVGEVFLTRGDELRRVEFGDMYIMDWPESMGPTKCRAMIYAIDRTKTTQRGHLYASAIRHRLPHLCSFVAVGLSFLVRFHLNHEPFPDFTDGSWADRKLVIAESDQPSEQLDYGTQLKKTSQIYEAIGHISSKKTHAQRGRGARKAEFGGASEDQIRKIGRWQQDALGSSYLSRFSFPTTAIMCGHGDSRGGFFVARAHIEPPKSLQEKLFPELEAKVADMERENTRDISAVHFINLLRYLRITIFQDAVCLMDRYPTCVLWNAVLFQDPEFLEFKVALKAHLATDPEKKFIQDRLRKADPAAAAYLSRLDANLTDVKQEFKREVAYVKREVADVKRDIAGVRRGLELILEHLVPGKYDTSEFCDDSRTVSNTDRSFPNQLPPAQKTPTTSPATSSLFMSQEHNNFKGRLKIDATGNERLDDFVLPKVGEIYLPGLPSSIKEVWDEFMHGRNGQCPIRLLNEKFGSSWRTENKLSKAYSNRKVLYRRVIMCGLTRNCSFDEAAKRLDYERVEIGFTVDQFRRYIMFGSSMQTYKAAEEWEKYMRESRKRKRKGLPPIQEGAVKVAEVELSHADKMLDKIIGKGVIDKESFRDVYR